jgi:hypothetical protein
VNGELESTIEIVDGADRESYDGAGARKAVVNQVFSEVSMAIIVKDDIKVEIGGEIEVGWRARELESGIEERKGLATALLARTAAAVRRIVVSFILLWVVLDDSGCRIVLRSLGVFLLSCL